ncbi:MAG: hypothetical protein HQL50_15655, partial [Magnetococcales bacterium]|nr:hypothetical protein [Magnetococcales bacterium]
MQTSRTNRFILYYYPVLVGLAIAAVQFFLFPFFVDFAQKYSSEIIYDVTAHSQDGKTVVLFTIENRSGSESPDLTAKLRFKKPLKPDSVEGGGEIFKNTLILTIGTIGETPVKRLIVLDHPNVLDNKKIEIDSGDLSHVSRSDYYAYRANLLQTISFLFLLLLLIAAWVLIFKKLRTSDESKMTPRLKQREQQLTAALEENQALRDTLNNKRDSKPEKTRITDRKLEAGLRKANRDLASTKLQLEDALSDNAHYTQRLATTQSSLKTCETTLARLRARQEMSGVQPISGGEGAPAMARGGEPHVCIKTHPIILDGATLSGKSTMLARVSNPKLTAKELEKRIGPTRKRYQSSIIPLTLEHGERKITVHCVKFFDVPGENAASLVPDTVRGGALPQGARGVVLIVIDTSSL